MSAGMTSIVIRVEGMYELTVDEVWPDGDAPEVVTAEVVRDRMEACGIKRQVLRDWNIDEPEVEVDVIRPNPAWKQDETLLPAVAPSRVLIETVEVWA